MTSTSSFVSALPALAVPLASLLRSSVVLIAASLGCVKHDGNDSHSRAALGRPLAAPLVPAVRGPGEAVHAWNDAAATALVTAPPGAGGGVAVQLAEAARASTVAIASSNDRVDLAKRVLGPT